MIGSLKCQVKKVKTDLLIPCYFAQWNGTVKNGICNYLSNCRKLNIVNNLSMTVFKNTIYANLSNKILQI